MWQILSVGATLHGYNQGSRQFVDDLLSLACPVAEDGSLKSKVAAHPVDPSRRSRVSVN
jgi:hypothetical protein